MALRRATSRLIFFGPAPLLALGGCPIDDRTLEAEVSLAGSRSTGGSAGSPGGGGPLDAGGKPLEGGSGGDAPLSGGESGAAQGGDGPSGPVLLDGCIDLDGNAVADCDETLAANARFVTNVSDWTADLSADLGWDERNAYGDLPSGSASVSAVGAIDQDGLTQASSTQCLPISSGAAFLDLMASFFIPPDQGEGLAGLGVFFFDQPACTGNLKSPAMASLPDTGSWSTLKVRAEVPDGAASMRVRLAVSKPFRTEAFEVLFDNVLVRLDEP